MRCLDWSVTCQARSYRRNVRGKCSALSVRRYDIHEFAVASATDREVHHTVRFGENGVVFAAACVHTRVEACAALSDDDAASGNHLSTVALHAKSFGFRIATVARTTACFFMCHDLFYLSNL